MVDANRAISVSTNSTFEVNHSFRSNDPTQAQANTSNTTEVNQEQHPSSEANQPEKGLRPTTMNNFTENIREVNVDESGGNPENSNANRSQKVITFKNRDYLLYEGRIIDEKEADRIFTLYHELLL